MSSNVFQLKIMSVSSILAVTFLSRVIKSEDINCGQIIIDNLDIYEAHNYSFIVDEESALGVFDTCLNETTFDTYLRLFDSSDNLIDRCVCLFIYFIIKTHSNTKIYTYAP